MSSPFSSIQTDALSVNKKLITFDSNKKYYKYSSLVDHLPNCSAYTIDELDHLIKYWLEIDIKGSNNAIYTLVNKLNIYNSNKKFIQKYKELINTFGEN